jgi:uncharacterized lipoprotein YehR (DUF1307 family)
MRRTGLAVVALLVAFALPGCGGDEESPRPAGDEPTTSEKRDYGY